MVKLLYSTVMFVEACQDFSVFQHLASIGMYNICCIHGQCCSLFLALSDNHTTCYMWWNSMLFLVSFFLVIFVRLFLEVACPCQNIDIKIYTLTDVLIFSTLFLSALGQNPAVQCDL